MQKFCSQFDDDIYFHYESDGKNIGIYYPMWRPESSSENNEWHTACELENRELDKNQVQPMVTKYKDLFLQTFDKCRFDGHNWGREFEIKGVKKQACKDCKTMRDVE